MSKKTIMLGNEAIARGAYEAGVKLSSAYPGTPSTEISEYLAKYEEVYTEWAPNEKVAAEVAIGASIAGSRSLACMKHVGLNVASDPLYTFSYTGVNGGSVLVVADDPGLASSHLRPLQFLFLLEAIRQYNLANYNSKQRKKFPIELQVLLYQQNVLFLHN